MKFIWLSVLFSIFISFNTYSREGISEKSELITDIRCPSLQFTNLSPYFKMTSGQINQKTTWWHTTKNTGTHASTHNFTIVRSSMPSMKLVDPEKPKDKDGFYLVKSIECNFGFRGKEEQPTISNPGETTGSFSFQMHHVFDEPVLCKFVPLYGLIKCKSTLNEDLELDFN